MSNDKKNSNSTTVNSNYTDNTRVKDSKLPLPRERTENKIPLSEKTDQKNIKNNDILEGKDGGGGHKKK